MKIKLFRIDERLIHGQITEAWVRSHKINCICIVDDGLPNNKTMLKILTMSVPIEVELKIFTQKQMLNIMESTAHHNADTSTMVLFRNLETAWSFFKASNHVGGELSLSAIPPKIGRALVAKHLYLSKRERIIVQDLAEHYGMRVVSQMLPHDPAVDVRQYITTEP